jgi:hypothetical protein
MIGQERSNEPAAISIEQSLVELISRRELDQQVETARAHPRSLQRFMDECRQMATLSETVAAECMYAIPRKENGVTKMIEGPSARLAEIIATAWTNNRTGSRIVEEGREFIVAQGVFLDLERNVARTSEVRRRITNRRGDRYSADMIMNTANAACSIAERNATLKGVPRALWRAIYDETRRVVAGDSKSLANRRSEALGYLQKLGATREMVLALLEVSGIEDIGIDELATLRGVANAIKEGEFTVEEAFATKIDASAPATSRTQQAKEILRQPGSQSGERAAADPQSTASKETGPQ